MAICRKDHIHICINKKDENYILKPINSTRKVTLLNLAETYKSSGRIQLSNQTRVVYILSLPSSFNVRSSWVIFQSKWSRKSRSEDAWTPVQALNMASNHGTIMEMSVFKGFKLWSLSEVIVLFRHCRRVKQWEENIALFSQVREPLKKGSRPIHSLIHSRS